MTCMYCISQSNKTVDLFSEFGSIFVTGEEKRPCLSLVVIETGIVVGLYLYNNSILIYTNVNWFIVLKNSFNVQLQTPLILSTKTVIYSVHVVYNREGFR